MTLRKIKKLKFYTHDLNGEVTIKEYLQQCMRELWREGECFSGKRPLGNSDWQTVIYIHLVKNKCVEGELDEDGYLESCDYGAANKIIMDIIGDM